MNDTQSRKIRVKDIALLILVAIFAAVAISLLQHLLLGESSAAITGGVVGAITAVMAIRVMKKKST